MITIVTISTIIISIIVIVIVIWFYSFFLIIIIILTICSSPLLFLLFFISVYFILILIIIIFIIFIRHHDKYYWLWLLEHSSVKSVRCFLYFFKVFRLMTSFMAWWSPSQVATSRLRMRLTHCVAFTYSKRGKLFKSITL